jgi:Immunoglobulin I-set domain
MIITSSDVTRCLYAAYSPTPRVVWTRLGSPLPSRASMPPEGFGQELVILDVQPDDAGHYQCSASNSIGTPITKVVSLYVECQWQVRLVAQSRVSAALKRRVSGAFASQ